MFQVQCCNHHLLQSNLNNLLRVRARMVERLYAIHKLHANYGRVFSEWSAKEKEMGDGLQVFPHEFLLCISALWNPLQYSHTFSRLNGVISQKTAIFRV
jgi:sorting nexin-4